MVAIVSFIVFSGALALAVAVIAMMISPQWQRIASLAKGRRELEFAPMATLAMAEHRIAVRHWANQPVPLAFNQLREAA